MVCNPDVVFSSLDNGREKGLLQSAIAMSTVRYQASIDHPGCLEQINSSGKIVVGRFEEGRFIVTNLGGKD